MQPETKAIRIQSERSLYSEHSVPLYLTSGFVFENSEEMRASFTEEIDRNVYSRYSNPNCSEFVSKMIALEGAEDGLSFASGMSAIFSTFAALLNAGDHVISCRSVFGSTHNLFQKYFPKWGIETTYFNVEEVSEIERLIQPSTKILYVETPTNPSVQILDLELLGNFAKQHNLVFIVDNCFATPIIQKPIDFGADLVIHSATKLIDGQGRVLGGITVGSQELIKEIQMFARHSGPSLSAFNAWLLSKSLETLSVRVEKHCSNALEIAKALEHHSAIAKVNYPFLPSFSGYEIAKQQMRLGGNIIAFELLGGLEAGRTFLDSIQLCSLSANLGDTRTIVTHPASTTHSKLTEEGRLEVGITEGLIRISVGLEHVDDLKEDLFQALDKIQMNV